MKLKEFRVTNYKSVIDSGPIKISDITCLVGKNEAGKTSLLKALNTLKPIRGEEASFSVTDDYPRAEVSDYQADIDNGTKKHINAITAKFELDQSDVDKIEQILGPNFVRSRMLSLSKHYDNILYFALSVDEIAAIKHLTANFAPELQAEALKAENAKELLGIVEPHANDSAVSPVIKIGADLDS